MFQCRGLNEASAALFARAGCWTCCLLRVSWGSPEVALGGDCDGVDGGKTPPNPSPCCILYAVGARWVSCKPHRPGTVWIRPEPTGSAQHSCTLI